MPRGRKKVTTFFLLSNKVVNKSSNINKLSLFWEDVYVRHFE